MGVFGFKTYIYPCVLRPNFGILSASIQNAGIFRVVSPNLWQGNSSVKIPALDFHMLRNYTTYRGPP